MRRRLAFVCLGLLLLVVAGVLLAHTPPVRSLALRFAIRTALSQGIQVAAERLEYNLATRNLRLANVTISAIGDPQPFFVADEVLAVASYRVFFGEVAFDEVSLRNGAVRIVRRADGTSNLPESSGTGGGDPSPIPIARISAPRLAVEYRDESADVAIRVPALAVDLSARGRIALETPADLSLGSTSTRIDTLAGEAAFDGRDLRLSNLRLVADELRGSVDGTLALIRRQPSIDIRVSGDTELQNAAKWWGQTDGAIRGSVHLEGTVTGALGEPSADLRITSNRVSWQRLDVANVSGRARLDGDGLVVADARAVIAGGEVTAVGNVAWEPGRARVAASWRDIDAAQLVTSLSGTSVVPSGRASGELEASGSIDAIEGWNVDARVALAGGRRARGRVPAPGEARFRLAAGEWGLDARHVVGEVTPVDVALTGRVRGSDIADSAIAGTLRASESDLQAILQMLSETGLGAIQQDLVAGSISASAEVQGTIGQPVLNVLVESDEAVVGGQGLIDVQARGRLELSTFDLEELSAAQPPLSSGEESSGRIRITGEYNLKGQTYTGSANVSSWRIDPTPDLPVSGLVGLDFSGRGQGTMVYGKGRLLSNLTVSQDIALGEITADVDLEGDRATIAARAPEFNAVGDGVVALDAPYHTTLRANAAALDLARAVRGIDLPVAVDGTADIRFEAAAPLEQWRDGRASLEVVALDARVQTLPVALREPARARYDGGRVVVERLEGSVGETLLSAAGALPLSPGTDAGDAVLATLTGDLYDVAVAAAVAADPARASSESPIAAGKGPLVLLARITGSLQSPSYEADLEIGPGMVQARADLAPVENLQVSAHLENGLLELRNFAGSYHGANVTATGQAPLSLLTGGTPSTERGAVFRATAVGVTSAVLAPFVDASTIGQVGGSLDAKLDLSSASLNMEDVQGEVVLERLNLTVADLPVTQRLPTRVVARDGVARVEAWSWESEGTSIEVSGQVHLSDRQAAIQADGKLDARLLTPFLGVAGITTAGQVDTRLSVTGALTQPTINGDVRLANGELRLREPRVVADELNAVAVLARGNAFITSLSGTVNGGTLSGAGQLQYSPELRGQFMANVSGMAMDFPEGLRTEVDSSLELTTTVKENTPANHLSGLVTIRRGAYREPLALVTGLLNNLQRSGTTTGGPASPFLESLTLDVRVITEEDLIIDNNVAKAQLGADLRLINVASAPALSGRAELREGGQLFLGRNTFAVQSGTIDFANPSMIEPLLGIEATTRVSGIDIEVRITGAPDNLMTELTSPTDATLTQLDLTSLLLTGRTADQLSEQQAAVVGAQVLGNLAGDVLGFAGRAVGLDTLRVGPETNPRDPADLASETDPTSRLTFGKSLGSKVDVTLSQSLVESNAQTWILDYLPIRRIALRFVQDDDELRSYEFRHDVTFGSAPNAIRSGDVSSQVRQPRISAIRVMGDLRFPEEQVRGALRLNEGDRFDFIDWQEDRDRLERFYHTRQHLAAHIVTGREESPDGVGLNYTIEAGPETHVSVTGATLPGSVVEEIETAWTQSVFEGFLIEEAEGIVRRELALQATYQPEVGVRIEGDESVRALIVDVTPGPRADRIDVRFEGIDEQLRSDLTDDVGDGANAVRALTNPREYERTVLNALRLRGYWQASVSVGVPVFEEVVATVPVTVKTGPQYRIGMVSFEGEIQIALDVLQNEVGLQEGAFYRPEDIEGARTRLQARYRREGFSAASIEAREEVRPTEPVVDVVFVVEQGPQQVVREITISGLRSVAEDVARRVMRIELDQGLRTSDWLDARRRLFESGLFRRVDISVEPLEGAADTSSPVALRVVVEEWPALRLRYGFQVAEDRPEENVEGRDLVPGVSADLTRRTLFGRAITVGVAGQYERLERLGRLFLNTPTLLGRPVQSSLILERSREDSRIDTLVTNRTTAAWEQRGRWRQLSLSYGLRFERNRTFDTMPSDPFFPFDVTVHIGRFTSSATWDSRDDASDSTRGTFISTSLENATSRLGSDLLFLRSLTQAYHFRSWNSVVFASAVRFGAVRPLGGQVLSRSTRFFAGGARTVRGVAEDSLGGLDFLGDPIGGRGLLTLNQEMRFPLYRWFRGAVFVDMGNVFPEVSTVRLNELVGSTGFGLRLVTPFALFRLDYGKTIWNQPVADSGRLVFGIGQTF
jgi:outer membrane protein assembly factor BamA/autotransporter translocation and assembly factor TamB